MRLELALALPRQARSVAVARHLVRAAMVELGVTHECVHDIEVAVSEACTNVLEQTGPSQEWELCLQVLEDRCVLRVVDIGQQRRRLRLALPAYPSDEDAQPGRGLQLLRALADRVGLATLPERGAVVSLEKRLVYTQPDPPSAANGCGAAALSIGQVRTSQAPTTRRARPRRAVAGPSSEFAPGWRRLSGPQDVTPTRPTTFCRSERACTARHACRQGQLRTVQAQGVLGRRNDGQIAGAGPGGPGTDPLHP